MGVDEGASGVRRLGCGEGFGDGVSGAGRAVGVGRGGTGRDGTGQGLEPLAPPDTPVCPSLPRDPEGATVASVEGPGGVPAATGASRG